MVTINGIANRIIRRVIIFALHFNNSTHILFEPIKDYNM